MDELGQAVMGQLWRTVYLTIQDAIPQGSAERCALSILLQVPSWIGKLIIGKDYSGFDVCVKTETVWSVNFYACSIIVGSGFCLWTVLGGRIIIRLWKDLRDLF